MRNENNFVINKEKGAGLICDIHPYGSDIWTISLRMRRKLTAADMCFCRRILGNPWLEHVNKVDVLNRITVEKTFTLKIRRKQLDK